MKTSEIKQRWLDYFESKDHVIRPSVPLVSPDPSILFTIAGMVPFIPYITGEQEAPWPRAASVQKSLRTNDIENVGKTSRHGTFFQMNGNFSFGDYFKEGAINFAFDLLTGSQEEGKYGLDADRMWVTIWEEDQESYHILTKDLGLDPAHIVRLTKEEIFWDTGQPGPAGPCAEWHYDRGPQYGPEAEGGKVDPGGDRYLEVWNLVFDQYMRGEGSGKNYPLLHELEHKSIDTGAGLERLAFVLQDKENMFEIDEVRPVITRAEELTGIRYGAQEQSDVLMRVVADHVRSSMMLIDDGVRPGNDGAGYVLRRLVRRAIRSMRLLGVEGPTLPDLFPVSRDAMAPSYPSLLDAWPTIEQVAYGEEDAFRRTLDAGTTIFDVAVRKALDEKNGKTPVLAGEDVFALHDTYGFPFDLTLEMAAEKGVEVDGEKFRALMEEQRQRARADNLAKKSGHADTKEYHRIASTVAQDAAFVGYQDLATQTPVVALLQDGQPVPVVRGPAHVELVLGQTPFYAEAGGQLADQGTVTTIGGTVVRIEDVQSPIAGLTVHMGFVQEGEVAVDDVVTAEVDAARRLAISRAHTATHVVHQVLHDVVSDQAVQAGSENSPSRLRFDFRHGAALSERQVQDVEAVSNEQLMANLEVSDQRMSLEQAQKLGAQALFGEKYGKEVRVVSIGGDWSLELCAGTHVDTTGSIGRLNILSESSVGSGIRRLDALVSDGSYAFQAKEHLILSEISRLLQGSPEELPEKVSGLLDRVKGVEKELAALQQGQLLARGEDIARGAARVGNVLVARADLGTVSDGDAARMVALDVRDRLGQGEPAVVLVGAIVGSRPVVAVATNSAAREENLAAGTLVRKGAQVLGGGGGGKPDVAQGGGTDPNALQKALDSMVDEVKGLDS